MINLINAEINRKAHFLYAPHNRCLCVCVCLRLCVWVCFFLKKKHKNINKENCNYCVLFENEIPGHNIFPHSKLLHISLCQMTANPLSSDQSFTNHQSFFRSGHLRSKKLFVRNWCNFVRVWAFSFFCIKKFGACFMFAELHICALFPSFSAVSFIFLIFAP